MLSEVTFVHQRGILFGLYWTTQNVVTSCLDLASSYEVAALGWHGFYWIYVIAVGVGLGIVIFGCFESRSHGRAQVLNGQVVITDQFGVTHVLSGTQPQDYLQGIADEARPKKTYV